MNQMTFDNQDNIYNVLLDGKQVDRVLGWDTAVARATAILRGQYGQLAELTELGTGMVAWRWHVSWDEPLTAVAFDQPEELTPPMQYNSGHTVYLTLLALLAISLGINIGMLFVLYILLF
jgi:hypothetical protein